MPTRISICMLLFCVPVPVAAQKVTWEKTGDTELIFSSENTALFAHPNGDLFAGKLDWRGCGEYCGSDGAVYRSLDGGQTWEQTEYAGDGVMALVIGTPEGVVDPVSAMSYLLARMTLQLARP